MSKYLQGMLLLAACLIAGFVKSQDQPPLRQITGHITNRSGEPVPGATILSKQGGTTALSDNQGRFTATVRMVADTLQVTHVGYQIRFLYVTGSTIEIDIVLESRDGQLEEVIVNTGYQRVKPNEINGSVVVIDNKTLNQQTGTNILERLNGVTSGLSFTVGKSNGNPQNNTNISIRGLSTINGPLDPLIVVDNFIFEGDIANINPDDVESVSILKDAAAASIWGARAGNGVIVITTKRASFRQPVRVSISNVLTVSDRPDLHDVSQLTSSDYLSVEQTLFNQGYYNSQISFEPFNPLSEGVEILLARRNGLISAADSASRMAALKGIDSRDEYERAFYRRAVTQQYALSLSGGSENLAWLMSGAVNRNMSSLDASLNKVNLRFDNTYRPFKRLTVNSGVYYTNTQSLSGAPEFTALKFGLRTAPYQRFSTADGGPLPLSKEYRDAFTDTAGGGRLLNWKYYPLEDYKHDRQELKREELIANLGMSLQVFPSLAVDVRYQYQRQRDNTRHLHAVESYYTRNMINLFTELNQVTGDAKYIVPMGGIIQAGYSEVSSQNLRAQAAFSKAYGKHQVSGIAGSEVREARSTSAGWGSYGYQASPLKVSNSIDHITSYLNYDGNTRSISNFNTMSGTVYRAISLYTNVVYAYDRRYSFSLSARRDGSNLFGLKTNDQWNPLWSAGAGWNISDEKFYKVSWLEVLRFKATVGFSGNVDITKTALPVSSTSSNRYNSFATARINNPPNPGLRWEKARQVNIGFEFATTGNRISGSIDLYHKKGTDLYGPKYFDYTTWGGSGTITTNTSAMDGRGLDLVIRTVNVDRKLKWSTQLLLNYNTSKVTAYERPEATDLTNVVGGGNSINPFIGKSPYSVAAYMWAGLSASGKSQGFLKGQPSTDYVAMLQEGYYQGTNLRYIGRSIPAFTGALLNSIEFLGFTLQANLIYNLGYYFQRPSLNYDGLITYGTSSYRFEDRWQKPGDEAHTNIPGFTYPNDALGELLYRNSDFNVSRADHIRLQFVNLGYAFRTGKKTPGKKSPEFNVSLNASNLGIVWKANQYGLDPDYPNKVKPPKSLSVSLRASF